VRGPERTFPQAVLRCDVDVPTTQTPVHFRVRSRAIAEWRCGAVPAFVLLAGCLAVVLAPAPLSSIAGTAALLSAVAFVVPGRLQVGTDSVMLRWLWTVRVVPLEEIQRISRYQEPLSWVVGLRLDLRSGVLDVPMQSPMGMGRLYWLLPNRVWGGPEIDFAIETIESAVEARARRLAGASSPGSGSGAPELP
jgi:hypothetical protein